MMRWIFINSKQMEYYPIQYYLTLAYLSQNYYNYRIQSNLQITFIGFINHLFQKIINLFIFSSDKIYFQ